MNLPARSPAHPRLVAGSLPAAGSRALAVCSSVGRDGRTWTLPATGRSRPQQSLPAVAESPSLPKPKSWEWTPAHRIGHLPSVAIPSLPGRRCVYAGCRQPLSVCGELPDASVSRIGLFSFAHEENKMSEKICGNCEHWACRQWGGNTNLLTGLCGFDGSIRSIGDGCEYYVAKSQIKDKLVILFISTLLLTGILGTLGFFAFLAWRAWVTS